MHLNSYNKLFLQIQKAYKKQTTIISLILRILKNHFQQQQIAEIKLSFKNQKLQEILRENEEEAKKNNKIQQKNQNNNINNNFYNSKYSNQPSDGNSLKNSVSSNKNQNNFLQQIIENQQENEKQPDEYISEYEKSTKQPVKKQQYSEQVMSTLKQNNNNKKKSFIRIEVEKTFEEKIKAMRLEIQHKQNCEFFNLNSLTEIPQNKINNYGIHELTLETIQKGNFKYKFNIYFIFSALLLRQKLQRSQASYYSTQEQIFVSEHDIEHDIEDLMNFLINCPLQNPFIFINKYFQLIFNQSDIYSNQGMQGEIIKGMLKDFVFSRLENQKIVQISNIKYNLYHYPYEVIKNKKLTFTKQLQVQLKKQLTKDEKAQQEEKIFLTISNFPVKGI
ncbi:hypothetical protein PPERSA_13044 [Pseudocohnilembus persalinus]|uniref:Uncharacterized protein n=1 Tax=Pseudocohnilembus persalinus TaxID=266149 RepID=A0A0V0R217_PSEPJ|nr:hypothetical protein PPERSA_13044 [Pseudocohnilembus persalinus]|eukprot:KRX08563.1 hypothetical protein PPERSA_13044 [Pseudocohnilembus persalinus]